MRDVAYFGAGIWMRVNNRNHLLVRPGFKVNNKYYTNHFYGALSKSSKALHNKSFKILSSKKSTQL